MDTAPTDAALAGAALQTEPPASPALCAAVGASTAVLVANLYYAQPLITTIAADLGLEPGLAGSVVSASQFGYGIGLFCLVPLLDMFENRRLVLTCGGLALAGIIGIATAQSAIAFLGSALMTGIFSSGAQMLIPYLSHRIPAAERGRVLGYVMAGVLTTVMLARPFALFVAAGFGWRTVYWISAAMTLVLGAWLWRLMPPRQPDGRASYTRTIQSMFVLFASERRVQRRTRYQAALFATFTMFWATIPILLEHRFALSQQAIGWFALVGAGGALAAPLAGRVADRGFARAGTVAASLLIAGSFLLSLWSLAAGLLAALVAVSVVIDGAIQAVQTFSRLVVLDVAPAIRGRINALYMTIVYLSGALGSVVGVSAYVHWGWGAVVLLGTTAGFAVAAAALLEKPERRPRGV